ncbi:MAG: hypothetical protein IJL59_07755 [Clostridia bacterium]|nr:hypothetical protein [Clostridia bacterium]MBQ9189728.1 hypothetical protein [Clostridia bacterium]MBR3270946.1 hypothetical protein [Clostridia bacterium]
MKNKVSFIGFALVCASTVLAIVSAILYNFAYIKAPQTYTLLIIAAIVGAGALALAVALGKEIPNLLAAAHAVLLMAALGVSIAPMVNEMGLVYAGLNPQTNLTGFITFAAFTGVAWLIAVIGAFLGVAKREK